MSARSSYLRPSFDRGFKIAGVRQVIWRCYECSLRISRTIQPPIPPGLQLFCNTCTRKGLKPSSAPPIPDNPLVALLQETGWRQKWVGAAFGASEGTIWHWANGRREISPLMLQWIENLPPLPSIAPSYRPDARGLALFKEDYQYRDVDIAEMLGVGTATVYDWLSGRTRLINPVVVWLKHGCPADWPWFPPGYPYKHGISGHVVKNRTTKVTKGYLIKDYKRGGCRWRRTTKK